MKRYGNARVHKYTGDGELIKSWGRPGTKPGVESTKPGEFVKCPHGICLDSDKSIYVSEVEDDARLQKFVRI